jgi:hypothetical protein
MADEPASDQLSDTIAFRAQAAFINYWDKA